MFFSFLELLQKFSNARKFSENIYFEEILFFFIAICGLIVVDVCFGMKVSLVLLSFILIQFKFGSMSSIQIDNTFNLMIFSQYKLVVFWCRSWNLKKNEQTFSSKYIESIYGLPVDRVACTSDKINLIYTQTLEPL